MTMATDVHEHTLNVQLGEVLHDLRPKSWRVRAEQLNQLKHKQGRPDILIEEASQWPVALEAEKEHYASAEQEASDRLGEIVSESGRPIESAIALVYPPDVRRHTDGPAIREAIRQTDAFEYALLTLTTGGGEERLPESGWLRGSVKDLAMLAHRAMMPAPRVERLVETLERGVDEAAGRFSQHHSSRAIGLGPEIAQLLGQADDQAGQTRRMAMTVLINALIFHEALAGADEFRVTENGVERRVQNMAAFRKSGGSALEPAFFLQTDLLAEWDLILAVNYWPIFATAQQILEKLPVTTLRSVLSALFPAVEELVQGGVTKSHDLTGVIFQRLIADRKFLATFYTRPAAAALLAGLAIPADQAPGGAQWGDNSIHALQVGDFACGTGTLLDAAYQRISILHELHGGDPKALHQAMMKDGLVGLDVLNIAVHLTAAMLAGSQPETPFEGECLLVMPCARSAAA